MRAAIALALLAAGCHWAAKPSPDEVCRNPCIAAFGAVDLYELVPGTPPQCSCYQATDPGLGIQGYGPTLVPL